MIGDIEKLLKELSAAGVRYLVVGGVAVVLYGYMRAAFDLDRLIDAEPSNVDLAILIIGSSQNCNVTVRGLNEAYGRASPMRIDSATVHVASIDDLIAMKRDTGRPQDAVDIEALLELQKPETPDAPFDGSFEGTRRRQAREGRKLSPTERLRWLESWNTELRSLRGRAS